MPASAGSTTRSASCSFDSIVSMTLAPSFSAPRELDPTNVRFGYAYAVALYSTGKAKASLALLDHLLALDENNRDVLAALASYHQEQGDTALAKQYGDRLRALTPGDGRR